MEIKIGHALRDYWKENKSISMWLEKFLRHEYKERYVLLCIKLKIESINFAQWLLKPVSNI